MTCEHQRSNPHGCMDCNAPWCWVCRKIHEGERRWSMGIEVHEDTPHKCVEKMRAVVDAARELYEDHIDPAKEYAQPLGEALAMLDKSEDKP